MSNAETPKVVIIGAGISGLACAHFLLQRGVEVTVVESSDQAGGVIQTDRENGFLCEAGPNSFQNTPEIMELITSIGLDDALVTADGRLPRYIYLRRKLRPLPMGPGGLLSTGLLSFGGKLRLLSEPWIKARTGGKEESLADFVTRRFGPQVLRNLVAPFVSGVYAGDPERLSAQASFPILSELEQKYGSVLKGFIRSAREAPKPRTPRKLCSFREGLHTLPAVLAERIGSSRLLLGARTVRTLSSARGSHTLSLSTPQGPLELSADAVVLAASAYRAAAWIEPLSRLIAQELSAIEFPPLASVCVAYKKGDVPHPLNGFGFLVPRGQRVRSLGCIWSSSLFPGRAPEGSVLFTIFVGGVVDPEVDMMDDEEIIDAVTRDLRITLGIVAPPRVLKLYRHQRAIPQYSLGHLRRLERIEAELKNLPGLYLAGNYLGGVSVGDCVKEAGRVAERVLKYLEIS